MRPHRDLVPALALLLSAAVAGCADSGSAGDWGGTVRDSAGVAVVDNEARGAWDGGEAWRFRRVVEVGGASEDSVPFGNVADVAVDSRDRIYVLDRSVPAVLVFDASGRHLRTLGSAGRGPGELGAAVAAVLTAPGDTLLVPDPSNGRIQRFGPDGATLASVPLALEGRVPVHWRVTPDGRPLVQLRSTGPDAGRAGGPEDLVRVAAAGEEESAAVLRLPPGEGYQVRPGRAPRIRLFAPEPLWDVLGDDRFVHATNDAYRLEIVRGGETVRIIRKEHTASRVGPAEKEAAREMMRGLFEENGVPPGVVEQFMESVTVADRYPAFSTLMAGPRGTILVQRVREIAPDTGGGDAPLDPRDLGAPEWDVFDPEGRFLGTVSLPERFTPMTWRGDRVFGVQRGALDVPSVVGLEIVDPAEDVAGDADGSRDEA